MYSIRHRVFFGPILMLLLLGLSAAFPVVAATGSAGTQQNSLASPVKLGMPVYIGVSLNGSDAAGVVNFNVQPESTSVIEAAITYPWTAYPSIVSAPSSSMIVIPSINPYPVTSRLPEWLQVSIAEPSAVMPYGTSATLNLTVTVGKPNEQGLAESVGAFEFECHYVDPLTGMSVNKLGVISITVSSSTNSTTTGNSPSPNIRGIVTESNPQVLLAGFKSDNSHHSSAKDPSWAIGAGLCDASSNVYCAYNDVQWDTFDAMYSLVYDSTWGSGTQIAYVMSAQISSSEALQAATFNTFVSCGGTPYTCTPTEYSLWSDGTSNLVYGSKLEIAYYSSVSEWGATQGSTVDYYNALFTGCCASVTDFYSTGQIPIAFESLDTTSSDFTNFANVVTPAWDYSTNGGSTWSSPSIGYLVDSSSTSWPGVVVGGQASTPTWFLAAGEHECSYSNDVVEYAYSGSACSGATNADGAVLW